MDCVKNKLEFIAHMRIQEIWFGLFPAGTPPTIQITSAPEKTQQQHGWTIENPGKLQPPPETQWNNQPCIPDQHHPWYYGAYFSTGMHIVECATLDKSIDQLVACHYQSLLVTRDKIVAGSLRLSDVLATIGDKINTCRQWIPTVFTWMSSHHPGL